MWDIIQNIIVFSIVMGIIRFLIKGVLKLIIIGAVIITVLYGINYYNVF